MEKYIKIELPSKIFLIIKRIFDILSAGLGIIFLSPFFIIAIPVIAIKMQGNPFFIQKRPGKNGKIFNLVKFRTMTNKKDKNGNLLPDKDRMTSFGTKMRDLSIDELPELWNILIGDMSVIGPRPQLVRDLWFMSEEEQQRHLVRPGLTGLAQISGRNAIDWHQKFKYDLQYIKDMSIKNDIDILLKTVGKVLKKADITEEGNVTATDYGIYLVNINQISQDEWNKVMEDNGK